MKAYEEYLTKKPISHIAEDLHLNRSTLTRAIHRIEERGTAHSAPRSGCPKKLSERSERHAERISREHPEMSFESIAAQLPEQPSLSNMKKVMHRRGIYH